jgi:hypothetical protein
MQAINREPRARGNRYDLILPLLLIRQRASKTKQLNKGAREVSGLSASQDAQAKHPVPTLLQQHVLFYPAVFELSTSLNKIIRILR